MECRTMLKRSAGHAAARLGAQAARLRAAPASVLFAACFGLAGGAEAKDLLASNGSWSLYRVQSYDLAVGNGEHVAVDGACVTEAVVDGVRLDFVTLIPSENIGREPFFGGVILQMTSSDWSFPSREASLSLVSGSMNLTVAGSLYDFDTVNFNMGGYGKTPVALRLFIHMASQPIEIVDDTRAPVAAFPSNGLLETFNNMLDCGTV